MRVKVGFMVGDRVTYNVRGEKIPAVIVAIYNADKPSLTEYEIRIATNTGKAYRKGEQFRTTGNWLSLRSRPMSPERKAERDRKATERKAMATLKELSRKIVR